MDILGIIIFEPDCKPPERLERQQPAQLDKHLFHPAICNISPLINRFCNHDLGSQKLESSYNGIIRKIIAGKNVNVNSLMHKSVFW